MNALVRGLLPLCLLLTPALQAQAVPRTPTGPQAASFSLLTGRVPESSLVGRWRFHPGDNPRWADPAFNDTTWPLLRSDQPWNKQGYPDLTGYAWYRFTVEEPNDGQTYSLLLPGIFSAYQVFLNGHLADTVGRLGEDNQTWDTWASVLSLPHTPGASSQVEVALRVWRAPDTGDSGGPQRGPSLVASRDLAEQQRHALILEQWQQLLPAVPLLVTGLLSGLVCLALFLQNRTDKEYLWFSLFSLFMAGAYSIDPFHVGRVVNTSHVNDLENFLNFTSIAFLVVFYKQLSSAKASPLFWLALIGPCLIAPWQVSMELLNHYAWRNLAAPFLVLPVPLWVMASRTSSRSGEDASTYRIAVPIVLWTVLVEYTYITAFFEIHGHKVPNRYLHLGDFFIDTVDMVDFTLIITLVVMLVLRFAHARREQLAAEIELRRARSVQDLLIAKELPLVPGYHIEAAYLPAKEVSGDFFQVLPLPEKGALVVIGDVAGKGMAAALTVGVLVGAIKALGSRVQGPAALLSALNDVVAEQHLGLTTCLALELSPNGTLRSASAGHPGPYRNGVELAMPGDLPLGIAEHHIFEESTQQLQPNDRLLLITDGVPEAMNKSRTLFGWERTASLSLRPAHEVAQAAQTFGQNDDITAVTLVYAA